MKINIQVIIGNNAQGSPINEQEKTKSPCVLNIHEGNGLGRNWLEQLETTVQVQERFGNIKEE